MTVEFRPLRAPLNKSTATLVAALMRRLGAESITLTEADLDFEAQIDAAWDYDEISVRLEVR